MRNLLK